MKLSRCIFTLGAAMGLAMLLTAGSAKFAQAKCGDGVTTVGEACDTGTDVCVGGKNPGAECCSNADCTGGGVCGVGNGSATNGIGNRDDIPNACRCSCMLPSCGDGVSDTGEQCDPGSSTSTSAPCLGNAPNTVCALNGVLLHGGGGNPNALISCTNDGQCAILAGGAKCNGNPQCNLAQCGDGFVCSDPSCLTGFSPLSPGVPTVEACDDGNTSNMDSCTSFGGHAKAAGAFAVPDQCFPNVCGDGLTNMTTEQCDDGTALCISGPKATAPPSKPCSTNDDCALGSLTGVCSSAVGLGNGNVPDETCTLGHQVCRTNCTFPSCGDGVSDTCDGEQCDDGTTANGPGHFCNKVRRCVGGENPGALCTDNSTCIKGTCGPLQCVQNVCGDDVVGGNEMCDDSNTVDGSSTDTCGVNATVAAGINAVLKPGCTNRSGTPLENLPDSCINQHCMLGLCGDGVTEPGEMCDGGASACSQAVADVNCALAGLPAGCVTVFNPGAVCCTASECKTSKNATGTPIDACSNSLPGSGANANDIPNRCRCNCMPPTCGDGVSDTGEQCEPPASGTFCIKNAMGMCVLNTCGDDDVCNKTAIDSFGNVRACTTGPGGGNEQCDDSNTIDPSATNTDTCFSPTTTQQIPINGVLTNAHCAAAGCGDGVTEAGEQCDSFGMGCSNGTEDLSSPVNPGEAPIDCCFDGSVVTTDKANAPGLLTVEMAFRGLLDCRFPHLIGAASCNKSLQKLYQRIYNRALAAEVTLENNDVTRSRRMMQMVFNQLNRTSRRIIRATAPGASCAGLQHSITGQNADASALAIGITANLTENNTGFGF